MQRATGVGGASTESSLPELNVNQLNEQVYELLKTEIIKGNLKPGERLSAGSLASRFGISVTPVRDALLRLSADGLVEITPRRGTTVSEFSREEVRETFHTRRIIECAAAGEVAEVSDECLRRMAAIVARFRSLIAGDTFSDYATYIALDAEFHQCIVDLLASQQLSEFYEKLRWPEQLVRGLALSNYQRAEATVNEHVAILRALQSRDALQAKAAVDTHLRNAEIDLLRRMPGGE